MTLNNFICGAIGAIVGIVATEVIRYFRNHVSRIKLTYVEPNGDYSTAWVFKNDGAFINQLVNNGWQLPPGYTIIQTEHANGKGFYLYKDGHPDSVPHWPGMPRMILIIFKFMGGL